MENLFFAADYFNNVPCLSRSEPSRTVHRQEFGFSANTHIRDECERDVHAHDLLFFLCPTIVMKTLGDAVNIMAAASYNMRCWMNTYASPSFVS